MGGIQFQLSPNKIHVSTEKITKFKKKKKLKKMQEDGQYSSQVSGTFSFEVFPYQKFFVFGAQNSFVCQSEQSCLRFTLAGKLYSLNKNTAQVAENAKNQFDKFSQAGSFESKESFVKFKTFLGSNLANKSQFKSYLDCLMGKVGQNEGFLSIKRSYKSPYNISVLAKTSLLCTVK